MGDRTVAVTVVYSPAPREVREWQLQLPAGSTVADAIAACGLGNEPLDVGVWGRKAAGRQSLRDRDRVEVYRPLVVDPKVARRERFKRQGARAAGLFARKR
jgi:putative ubiquitin-RnfH superfamily antitoxin RatB of RatAB toxin-antitoxin module